MSNITILNAECAGLSVVTQGKTLDELAINLKEAVALHLEGENPAKTPSKFPRFTSRQALPG